MSALKHFLDKKETAAARAHRAVLVTRAHHPVLKDDALSF
jgi:hypothetical protein